MKNIKNRLVKIDSRRCQVFELEIMATGYALVVSSVTTIVCKIFGRSKLQNLKKELNEVKALLSSAQTEIGRLKIALGEQAIK